MPEAARHPGARAWLLQRFSALLLLPLVAWFLLAAARYATASPATVRAWLGEPLTAVLLVSFLAAVAWHLVAGVQVVADDYLPDPVLRRRLMAGVAWAAAGSAFVGTLAVSSLALGLA